MEKTCIFILREYGSPGDHGPMPFFRAHYSRDQRGKVSRLKGVDIETRPSEGSRYFSAWETIGTRKAKANPFPARLRGDVGGQHIAFTVRPGTCIFQISARSVTLGMAIQRILFQVPLEPDWEEFCQLAEKNAGMDLYNRILGRESPTPIHDFTGGWMVSAGFAINTWPGKEDEPQSLQEAMSMSLSRLAVPK